MPDMPDFVWIVISALMVTVVVYLMVVASSRGLRASHGRTSIVIAGNPGDTETPIGRALQYVQQWTPEIQHVLFGRYLRLMKDAGADPALLTDYDDARFAKALFRYLVSGGNGTQSIQKILEDLIVNGEWRRENDHIDEYVQTQVWPIIVRRIRDYLNAEYDTTVLQMDGSRRNRWVSNTDLVAELTSDEIRSKCVATITPIFRFAQDCVQSGCS